MVEFDYKAMTFPGGYSPYKTRGDCWFDERTAALSVQLSPKYFVHTKGEMGGQPLALEPWQVDIVATTFGWKRPDGRRRYRMVYCEIPRGNGKSTMCVLIGGVLLFLDDEHGADIFSVAGTREQSKEVFGPFKMNCLSNPTLKNRTRCYVNSITHIDPRTGIPKGVYKAISADADHQHGGSPHGVIFDELHVQPNRDLWDVMWTGAIKRRNALTVALTTAGFDKHSICYEQRLIADKIRFCKENSYDGGDFLPVVYAADPNDDWTSPETWRKANPNIGVSVLEEDLGRECQRAKETPTYENTFKRLYLNIWTEQDVRWMPDHTWMTCTSASDPIEWRNEMLVKMERQRCYGGLDLSTVQDLTALTLWFPREDGPDIVLPFFWLPEDYMHQRVKRDRVPYDVWARQGFIKLTAGSRVDHSVVRKDISDLCARYNIASIARDPWNAEQLTQELLMEAIDMVDCRQGYASMSEPTKELERRIIGKDFDHGGNPVLRWNINNAAAEQDAAGNIKLSKKKSTERIDGAISTVMALRQLIENPTDEPTLLIL